MSRFYKNVLAVCVVFLLPVLSLDALAAESGAINWVPAEVAKDMQAKQGKGLYLYFYADWCHYCKKMESETLKDQGIAGYINANYVPVRINGDKDPALAAKFRVQGFPAHGFSEKEGKPVSMLPGYVPPAEFLVVLKYVRTGSYEKMSLDSFMEAGKQTEKAEGKAGRK
jgi:thioredoxin-related protein